ncbi:MAG: hypothetical protein HQ538_05095 [Parcubacteria group bacterium]|nr:hypothetical protein [Parcubacteria group bacterium]
MFLSKKKQQKKHPPKVLDKFKKEFVTYHQYEKIEKKSTKTKIIQFILNYWKKSFFVIIAFVIIWTIFVDSDFLSTKFPSELTNPKIITFEWEYDGLRYSITEILYGSVYEYYNLNPEKELYEYIDEDDYLINFLSKSEALEDNTISKIVQDIKLEANKRNLSDDELIELIIAFVQFIPYDDDKLAIIESEDTTEIEKTWPRFPYEVLYENKGVCSGKTFLTIMLLKKIGYGMAMFDFDDEMHVAPAIKCTKEYSSYDSGYCFAEVTQAGYKIGEIPQMEIGAGKPKSRSLINLFNSEEKNGRQNLSKLENAVILSATDGKSYEGIIETIQIIEKIEELDTKLINLDYSLDLLEQELIELENNADYYERLADKAYDRHTIWEDSESYNEYKRLYSQYESAYSKYKSKYNYYKRETNRYNNLTKEYNAIIEN